MPWTDADRHYFLGNRESFENRYCRNDGQLATLSADRIVQSYLNRLIFKLTCVLPALSHRSPGWTATAETSRPQKPIIAMGSVANVNLQRRNRCGLCEVDGRVFFWVDNDNDVFDPTATPGWVWWRTGSTGNDHQYRHQTPISPDVIPDRSVLLIMGQLNRCHAGEAFTAQQATELWLREPAELQLAAVATRPDGNVIVPRD